MKILAFSINPIFPDQVTGGASKHLERLMLHLGSIGHDVVLLCAKTVVGVRRFKLGKNVEVKAILPFHLPFPQPYAVTPYELTNIIRLIQGELQQADRFYIHDSELLLPGLATDIPVVCSVRDIIYPESVLGTFISQADEIACVSQYSFDVVKYTAGAVLSQLNERLHLIPNGLDPQIFHPTDPSAVAKELDLDLIRNRYLLFPHRPEAGKGFRESLEVLHILVQQYGYSDLVLLAPDWLEGMRGSLEQEYKKEMLDLMEEKQLEDNVRFHKWLRQDQMAGYYSLGKITLSIGKNPEAFGNVAYESLACGTPSVVARVGTHRTQLPDHLIFKTDYGNPMAAAALCADILEKRTRVSAADQQEVLSKLSLVRQLKGYTDLIVGAKKREPLKFEVGPASQKAFFKLAPWCELTNRGIFHDYIGKYLDANESGAIKKLIGHLKTNALISSEDLGFSTVNELIAKGVIVPVQA